MSWQTVPESDFRADSVVNDEPWAPEEPAFSQANISKHAGAGEFTPADGGCRICHEPGHFARDCPQGPTDSNGCFRCGGDHMKKDCPEKPSDSGVCFGCGESGHIRADCPSKPAEKCRVCLKEGHIAKECPENRLLASLAALNVKEISPDDAWALVEAADAAKEIEDLKRAILTYAKAAADTEGATKVTFESLEETFREAGMKTFLIAKEQNVALTHTIMNLQGEAEQKYVVSFQHTSKPRRAKFAEGWPKTPEENMARLSQAGFVMDNLMPKCTNCNELGHTSRKCEQEKVESAKVAITCANCNAEGHRARDCKEERKVISRGCRNCGQEDHMAKDCPEPLDLSKVECKHCGQLGHMSRDCPSREPELCRNCGQEGHRAKDCTEERVMKCRNCDGYGHAARDCPEPKDMSKIQCRNCDDFGHESRQCPKPTDWSRVECKNCHEKGHSHKRCKNPPADAVAEFEGGDAGWDNPTAPTDAGNAGGWDSAPVQAVEATGW